MIGAESKTGEFLGNDVSITQGNSYFYINRLLIKNSGVFYFEFKMINTTANSYVGITNINDNSFTSLYTTYYKKTSIYAIKCDMKNMIIIFYENGKALSQKDIPDNNGVFKIRLGVAVTLDNLQRFNMNFIGPFDYNTENATPIGLLIYSFLNIDKTDYTLLKSDSGVYEPALLNSIDPDTIKNKCPENIQLYADNINLFNKFMTDKRFKINILK